MKVGVELKRHRRLAELPRAERFTREARRARPEETLPETPDATHRVRFWNAGDEGRGCSVTPLRPVDVVIEVVDEDGEPVEDARGFLWLCLDGGPSDTDGRITCTGYEGVSVSANLFPPHGGSAHGIPSADGPLELTIEVGSSPGVESYPEPQWRRDEAAAEVDLAIVLTEDAQSDPTLHPDSRAWLQAWGYRQVEVPTLLQASLFESSTEGTENFLSIVVRANDVSHLTLNGETVAQQPEIRFDAISNTEFVTTTFSIEKRFNVLTILARMLRFMV